MIAKRKSDIALYADELGRGLLGELDYNIEAKNATEFLEAHAQYSFISIPKVYRHLSRKKVLTMQWMVGKKPNELLSLSRCLSNHGHLEKQQLEAKNHLLDMVNKGVEASLIQLLETGLLHADPHAGNLRYTPSGQIGFLDFGLLCRIEKKHQFALLASILHIANGDWPALVHDLSEMDVIRPETDLNLVTMDLVCSLDEITFNNGIPDVKFSKEPVSLLHAFISSGASSFRQYVAQLLGNIIYNWVSEALGKDACMKVPDVQENSRACGIPISAHQFCKILWMDRRVKVILGRILQRTLRRPLLMLRFSWCSFLILLSAFAQTYRLLRGLEIQINFFGTPKNQFALNV